MVKRIGLSMRVTDAVGYSEPRDSIAQDWYPFLAYALPEVSWVLLPNLGADIVDYINRWHIDGFILSGGNDLGEAVDRDLTEQAILGYALENGLYTLGVCRGLQMMQSYFCGEIDTCLRQDHVAIDHRVVFTERAACFGQKGIIRVNSYHTQAVSSKKLASGIEPFAITEDGWAEGIVHNKYPLTAVQWHPERMQPYTESDCAIVRQAFGAINL